MTKIRIGVVPLSRSSCWWSAPAALAHVEPDPNRVKPGKKATVEFTPEHGCGESVTTQMDFLVPNEAKNAKPVKLDGWTASVKGRKIRFASDEVPSEEQSFGITFTAPNNKTLLAWKVVQRCQDGVERWLEGPTGENPPRSSASARSRPRKATRRARVAASDRA